MASSPGTRLAETNVPPGDLHGATVNVTADESSVNTKEEPPHSTTSSSTSLSTSHPPSPSNSSYEKSRSESRPVADSPEPKAKESQGSNNADVAKNDANKTEKPASTNDTEPNAASPPPLPDEPLPDVQGDDGWDPMWSDEHQSWYFFNRFTQQTQWENPRVPEAAAGAAGEPVAGGYNPAIHGDYDPNAWYAKGAAGGDAGGAVNGGDEKENNDNDEAIAAAAAAGAAAIQNGDPRGFQSRSGGEDDDYRYSNEAKANRQMNAYFDVAAAGSAHDGRSLKAERSGKKPSRSELKTFREKRRAKKEEKRRAWLRD